MALLRAGERRHVGVPAALDKLKAAYVATQNAPGDNADNARNEVDRLINGRGGVGTVLRTPTPPEDRGCRCALVLSDEDILQVLRVQGDVMADELRGMVGAERYDAVVGAAGIGEPVVPRQGWTATEHTAQASNGHATTGAVHQRARGSGVDARSPAGGDHRP